jgi:hypothetical protein
LEAAQKVVNGGLTDAAYKDLATKQVTGKLTTTEKDAFEKPTGPGRAPPDTRRTRDACRRVEEAHQEQVDSLKAFVERKKTGIKDDLTVARLFARSDLFHQQVRYAGEYADPKATDKTDQLTTIMYIADPAKQGDIVAAIEAILADLDKAVIAGVNDKVLALDQTEDDRLNQLKKLEHRRRR